MVAHLNHLSNSHYFGREKPPVLTPEQAEFFGPVKGKLGMMLQPPERMISVRALLH